MHQISYPSILYFGTPVVLLSTMNENGTYNLAPISSVFWLGWRCIIGISALSKTSENILRAKECVVNLPSVDQVGAVNRLALTTGCNPVPEGKKKKGYRYESDKFKLAGLTACPSNLVNAPRVVECPVNMETTIAAIHSVAADNELQRGKILNIELKILSVHIAESILMAGHSHRVDPNKWRPLIMSFQEFYGLGKQVHPSALGKIPEHLYNTSDRQAALDLNLIKE